jgi:lipopolysaccharide transport system ATP-binding protein
LSTAGITIEGLGKEYRVAHQGARPRYRALRDVLAAGAKRLVEEGRLGGEPEEVETFWALREVCAEIGAGDVVGIIGKNGAGKSTLLKVLSRITEPSEGRVRIRGRIASLLEVGTGFHPELTGRENVFLNGAILGMRKAEITAKFDEIVEFAGVEKFLDTPVKRYSSGMYVRLAFAVAAHLEPEILVVDEVLAVGDAEFQRRCLRKIESIGRSGRTVLFVSHNMAAVKSLTRRGIVLSGGRLVYDGPTDEAIQKYATTLGEGGGAEEAARWGRGRHTRLVSFAMLGAGGEETRVYEGGEMRFVATIETDGTAGMSVDVFLADSSRIRIGMASTYQFHGETLPREAGTYRVELTVGGVHLASGRYAVEVRTSVANVSWDHSVENALEFEVPYSNPLGYPFDFRQDLGYGPVALLLSKPCMFERVGASR